MKQQQPRKKMKLKGFKKRGVKIVNSGKPLRKKKKASQQQHKCLTAEDLKEVLQDTQYPRVFFEDPAMMRFASDFKQLKDLILNVRGMSPEDILNRVNALTTKISAYKRQLMDTYQSNTNLPMGLTTPSVRARRFQMPPQLLDFDDDDEHL